ncbi:endolytic transglycosylase MltG [Lonepinella koalarum]|uniref:endolytic transglycosylase MltG n=1 Tax=Lonepinella koalarum TaxID=53417 RepID=UPI0011E4BCFF|nr:endolytic transglycosylase MltG [Lonepinella koalarum]TYG34221.1 endolytic transglycosylase MltG [Lonepinella koalarum]
MKKILFLFVILVLAGGGWGYYQIQQVLNQSVSVQPDQLLTVKRGTTGKKLADLFEQEQLVNDAKWLPWALKLQPHLNNIKAGTYSLNGVNTLADVLTILNEGKEVQFSIRFTEGETWREVKKSLQNAPHLAQSVQDTHDEELLQLLELPTNSLHSLEGWIYPDTYHYVPDSTDLALLKRSTSRTKKLLDQLWAERDDNLPLKNSYDMLILASIVEKESGIQAERGLIASVFLNRLKLNMKLQTDPTVIYGMGENYHGNIRKKDLETLTAYNTYIIDGLPPTPIANPSESALQAVAHPEKTDFLYFVADGTGGHKFSRNLSEHNQAVQEYLRWYRQNNKDKK